jgi:hypothetical protein
MKSLTWKELRENFKWATLPTLVIGGLMALLAPPSLMDDGGLLIFGLIAAVFGAVLGFLQIHAEARGDKRSLLLHRPLSRSRIFAAKAIVGVGLYLLALGAPFALAIWFAANPGHIAEPFEWRMTLPWLADVLTGLVYYFAGMLAAQREARWYGSRCLGLAAAFLCSVLVWTLPEFWHALLAIAVVGGLQAMAAWGSFVTGGAYAPQPRLAKVALALTLLIGLSTITVAGKLFLGVWTWSRFANYSRLDHQGRILLVHEEYGKLQSITDLDGDVPPELRGADLNYYTLQEGVAPRASGGWPNIRCYRNTNRALVKYGNATKPGHEEWWYVPDRGRLYGFDKHSKQPIGSFGPDGFAAPEAPLRKGFQGEIVPVTRHYLALAGDYLTFPGGVYSVDFRHRTLQTLFVPADGETVEWASRWRNEDLKDSLAFVGTDKSIHVFKAEGAPVLSVPVAFERKNYFIESVGRLENPVRYWVWYEPSWYLPLDALETMPAFVVEYNGNGVEIARREVPPRPGLARAVMPPMPSVEPSQAQAWFGLLTPPAETAALVGTTHVLESDVRGNNGTELWLLLQLIYATTHFFIPGVRWLPGAHTDLMMGHAVLMLFSAALSAGVCFALARRSAFSRLACIGWALCGLLFGFIGLFLMLALHEWPARIVCPKCRKPRVVTRDNCEHCGASHASPIPDGTEILESTMQLPQAACCTH